MITRRTTSAALALLLALPGSAAAAPYLSVSQSGGFAGVSSSLTVSASGRARTTDRTGKTKRFRLSTKRLHALKRHVKQADFAHLRKSYGPQNCSDAFEFALSHGGRDVTIIDCHPKLPRRLAVLVDDVTALLP